MEQIKPFSDRRFDDMCAYCGNNANPPTRDHIPSKILLDKPFPDNLPVTLACLSCNIDFSLDEEYLACLIECVLCGTTNPAKLKRPEIRTILSKKGALKERLEKATILVSDNTVFIPEEQRVKNVIIKLAKGHARFENSEPETNPPTQVWFGALATMPKQRKDHFLLNKELKLFPEIGSRSFQTIHVNKKGIPISNWKIVQPNNYEYSVCHDENGLGVRIVIRGYLACEAIWN